MEEIIRKYQDLISTHNDDEIIELYKKHPIDVYESFDKICQKCKFNSSCSKCIRNESVAAFICRREFTRDNTILTKNPADTLTFCKKAIVFHEYNTIKTLVDIGMIKRTSGKFLIDYLQCHSNLRFKIARKIFFLFDKDMIRDYKTSGGKTIFTACYHSAGNEYRKKRMLNTILSYGVKFTMTPLTVDFYHISSDSWSFYYDQREYGSRLFYNPDQNIVYINKDLPKDPPSLEDKGERHSNEES
jgi:hypothetical protein